MQSLARVSMLSVVVFVCFVVCGVAFGHSNFNPKGKDDPCVDYEKRVEVEYFWPRYVEYSERTEETTTYAHGWGKGNISGPAVNAAINAEDSHTCYGHWMEYRRQQKSQQTEEDPPEENEPTPPNTDSDSIPSEGEGGSTPPASGTETNTETAPSSTPSVEPEPEQAPEPAEMHCKKYPPDECFEWDFHTYPYAGLPIVPQGIKTLGRLWHYWRNQTNNKNFAIRLMKDGRWEAFKGGYTGPLYDIPITPHLGIYLSGIKTAYVIGKPVAGEEIELVHPDDKVVSVHMVGFPEVPANYKRLSDIAEVDGVDWVQRRIRKDDRLRYENVYGVGDATDDLIVRGQAVMIRIRKTVTLDLKGEMPEVATAPSVSRKLTTSWGHIKMHNLTR